MTVGKKIGAGFGLTVVMLVTVGALSFLSVTRLVEYNRWVIKTHKILTELEEVQLLFKNTEARAYGFVLSGDEKYLDYGTPAPEPYRKRLERLARWTEDNPKQQEPLERLTRLLDQEAKVLFGVATAKRKQDPKGQDAVKAAGDLLRQPFYKQMVE